VSSYTFRDNELKQATVAYGSSGAICIKGSFKKHVEVLRSGVTRVLERPGPFASVHEKQGRFFEDYCNWERIDEFQSFVLKSSAGSVASTLLSMPAQFFHDHVIVKDAGPSTPTPWHQDAPYFPIDAPINVSFWISLDYVDQSESPQFVEGSHNWPFKFAPRSFEDGTVYTGAAGDSDGDTISSMLRRGRRLSWTLEPGDFIAFNFRTLHGAPNTTMAHQRRAFVMRWVGLGARYLSRQGAPPYPWHDLTSGQALPEERFPTFRATLERQGTPL